jgi:apolipoprotein N-acyltransferase
LINFLLPSAGALLLYLSFHPANLWPLAWFALIPLIHHAVREPSGKRVFFASWLAGTVFFTPAMLWLVHTAPFGPFVIGLYLGIYWALFALVIRRLCLRGRWPVAIAAPVAWVMLEYVRAHLIGGFPWFLAGYSQHEAGALIQIADLGGVWLVSALVLFVNAAAAQGSRRWSAAALGVVVVSIVYGSIRLATLPRETGPVVGIVQPNIPQDVKNIGRQDSKLGREIFDKHVRLTSELVERHPEIAFVAWPESVLQTGIFYDRSEKVWLDEGRFVSLREAVRIFKRPLLAGVLIGEVEPPKFETVDQTNSALLIGAEGTVVARYDKIRLVQFTEAMPFEPWIPVKRIVASFLKVRKVYEFRRGEGPVAFEAGGRRFGVCICSENSYPDISRNLAGNGASAIVNISNEAWFRESAELDLMFAMGKFRAIENRVPVIRATNSGISAVIDAGGRPVRMLEDPEGRRKSVEGSMAVAVPAGGGPSVFGRVGDAVAWMAAGAALAGMAWSAFSAKR